MIIHTKPIPTIIAFILCGLSDARDRQDAASASTPSTAPARQAVESQPSGNLDTLCNDLKKAISGAPNVHYALRACGRIAEAACNKKPWDDVAKALVAQGLNPPAPKDGEESGRMRCVVSPNAVKIDEKVSFDLYLECSVEIKTSKTQKSKYVVYSSIAGLEADLDVALESVMLENRFIHIPALDRALRFEGVVDGAKVLPILKKLDISYQRFAERRIEFSPRGFHVKPTLVRSVSDESESQDFELEVPSGLDPYESFDGRQAEIGFVSKDDLAEVQSRGGTRRVVGRAGSDSALIESNWGKYENESNVKPAWIYDVGDLKTLADDTESIVLKKDLLGLEDVKLFARFKKLQQLDLSRCKSLTDEAFEPLGALQELRSLVFSGEGLSCPRFINLLKAPRLERLIASDCSKFGTASYEDISNSTTLRRLWLHWAENITDDDLEAISKMSRLEELSIWGCGKITDRGIEHISNLPELRRLSISHSQHVTDAGIAQLVQLKHLENLTIGYMNLGDATLEHISEMTTLRSLSLHGLKLTDAGVKRLNTLQKAVWLQFHDCGVSGDAVRELAKQIPGEHKVHIDGK
ncbi:MAG: hypothetical protein HY286_06235 [Planctomycetes bacterium]|nr:hypothetical protein [Planctomycetota bacterium]